MFRGVVQIYISAMESCLYDLGFMLGSVVLIYIALGYSWGSLHVDLIACVLSILMWVRSKDHVIWRFMGIVISLLDL